MTGGGANPKELLEAATFCERCGHEPHDHRTDPRCPAIAGADWGGGMPEPIYCACVDVDALYLRATRAERFIGSITPDEWATIDKAREAARLRGADR